MADKSAKSPTKKAPAKKSPQLHPSFHAMALEAVKATTDSKGVSVPAIRNYITEKYKSVDPNTIKYRLKQALTRAVEKEDLVKSKNSADRPLMSSRFRINKAKKEKKTVKKESTEKKVVKSKTDVTKKKTAATTKATKKPAAKKTPVKKAPKVTKPKIIKSPAAKKVGKPKPKTPKTPKSAKKAKKAK